MLRHCQSYKQQPATGNKRMPSWYTLASPQPLAAAPLPMTQHPLSKICRRFFASKRFNELNEVKITRPRNYLSYTANSIPNGFKNNSLLHTIDFNKIDNVHEWAILNSGASSHFLLTEAPVLNKIIAQNPIDIRLPDGSQVQSSHIGELDNPNLPATARTCHIVPGLASHSLISVVKLSNTGSEITFTKFGTGVEVRYRNRLI